MAVVKNFWLRDNTQKLGGAVIYQSKGQTLMRQLAPSVTNPRTDAQMEQRVKLANLVAFYRASASWMRGAFETKPSNQSDYNAFVSANAAANAVWLTKSQVAAGNAVVAPYIISRGSLGEITQTAGEDLIVSNLYVGDLAISSTTTIAELAAALINNNNGIQEGDQLSIVQYIQNTSTDGNYTITCRPYEVILSLSDARTIANYLPMDILGATGGDDSSLAIDTELFTGGVAFLLSRTQSGRILVTSSSVTLTPDNSVYAAMITSQQQAEAIRSYGENTVVFLDSSLADESNANVTTQASILALVINGSTYAPGTVIPSSYAADTSVQVLLSAPVAIGAEATLSIGRPYNTSDVEFTLSSASGSAVTAATFDGNEQASIYADPNTTINVNVILDTATAGNIQATFKVDGGLG